MGLHFFLPVRLLVSYPGNLVGVLPILFGIGLNILADQLLKSHNTTVKPFQESTAIVTSGVYRWTRNPMYLGMVLILLGAGWIAGSVTALIPWLVFGVLMDRVFIKPEESMLASKHPDKWLEYSSRVRRWV
jgi:protein-S-isoprenylcysteine O-methyltransferase Ste14